MNKLTSSRGFTLIELLVVIAIIGVLASTVLTSVSGARKSARDASRIQQAKELQKALELYRNANNGNYPCTTISSANCSATPPTSNGGASNSVINGTGADATFLAAIASYYTPQSDIAWPANGSINYRVGSATNNNNSPVRDTYTILMRFENDRLIVGGTTLTAGNYCSISYGVGHSLWNGTTVTPQQSVLGNAPPCF